MIYYSDLDYVSILLIITELRIYFDISNIYYHIVKKLWRNCAFKALAKNFWQIQGLPHIFSARCIALRKLSIQKNFGGKIFGENTTAMLTKLILSPRSYTV